MKGSIDKLIKTLNWPENEKDITYNATVKTLPDGSYELSIKNLKLSPAALAALELANAPSGAKDKPKAPTTTELRDLMIELVAGLKVELTAEFKEELTQQISDLRTELKAEMAKGFAEVNRRLDRLEKLPTNARELAEQYKKTS